MKLPGIQFHTGVKTLGRESAGELQAVTEARSAAIGSRGRFGKTIAVVGSEGAGELYDWFNERQVAKAEESYNTEKAKERVRSAQEEYTPDEIDPETGIDLEEDVIDEAGNKVRQYRTSIPAEEAYPEIYKHRQLKITNEVAQQIASPQVRRKWLAEKTEEILKTYAEYKVAGVQAISAQERAVSESKIREFIKLGMYDEASQTSRNGNFSKGEREIHALWIKNGLEADKVTTKAEFELEIQNLRNSRQWALADIHTEKGPFTEEEKKALKFETQKQMDARMQLDEKEARLKFSDYLTAKRWDRAVDFVQQRTDVFDPDEQAALLEQIRTAQGQAEDIDIADLEGKLKRDLQMRNFERAVTRVLEAQLPKEDQDYHLTFISRAREAMDYNDNIDSDNIEGLRQNLEFLSRPYDEYTADGGILDDATKRQYRRAIKGILVNHDEEATRVSEGEKALANRDAKEVSGALQDGQLVHPRNIAEQLMNPLVSDVNKADITEFAKHQPTIVTLHQLPNSRHQEIIDQAVGGKTTPYALRKKRVLEQASVNIAGLDPIVRAKHAKMINSENWPALDYSMDEETGRSRLGATIKARIPMARRVGERFGSGNRLVSKIEAREIGNHLNSLKPLEQMALMESLHVELGPEARNLYDQMNMTRSAGRFGVVGRLMSEGKYDIALDVLNGPETRANTKAVNMPKIQDIEFSIMEYMGTTMLGSPNRRALVDSMINTYISRTVQTGTASDIVDEKQVQGVIQDFLGGEPITVGISTIAPPADGMNELGVESWLRAVPKEFFEDQGGIKGYSSKKLIDNVLNGTFYMKQVARDTFIFVDPSKVSGDGRIVAGTVKSKTGFPIWLRYDPALEIPTAPPEANIIPEE